MVQLLDDFIFLRVTHVTTVTKSTLSQGCGFSYVLGTAVFNVLLESYMRGNEDGLRKNNFNLMRSGEPLKTIALYCTWVIEMCVFVCVCVCERERDIYTVCVFIEWERDRNVLGD
jgi:hypothetical protein